MSDQELVQNVPAALHAMVEACTGEYAVGGLDTGESRETGERAKGDVGSGEVRRGEMVVRRDVGEQAGSELARMPGLDPAVTPDEDALEYPADAPAELMLLRTQQQYALEDLIAGKNYSDAARTAGVNRRTLFRWVNHDPAFKAALEAWRRRTVRSVEDRLMQGTEVATTTLMQAAGRDFRAAALLLKGRGMLPGPPRQFKPVEKNPLVLAVPPGKRRAFEVRLRELILSFKEEGGQGSSQERVAGSQNGEGSRREPEARSQEPGARSQNGGGSRQ